MKKNIENIAWNISWMLWKEFFSKLLKTFIYRYEQNNYK